MTLVHVSSETAEISALRGAEISAPSGRAGGVRGWWARRQRVLEDERRAAWLVGQFRAAAIQAGLATEWMSAAGLAGLYVPTVTSVTLGPAPRLSVQPLPGQLLADFQAVAGRLAAALHVDRVRLSLRSNGLIGVELVRRDPLRTAVDLPAPVASVREPVTLGRVESGELVAVSLVDIAHLVVQGQTRSGKSRFLYSLLAQVAACPDVIVAGSDVTGLLLQPYVGTRHAEFQAVGSDRLEQHVELFEGLVERMQGRVAVIPRRADVLPVTLTHPLIIVVVEEYGVLVELLGAYDTWHKTKLQSRFRAALRNLLAGGAKVGIRVLLVTQRADATGPAGLGGFERGQAAVRLSFRVDNADACKMLHPGIPVEQALEHAGAAPGVALLSGPELLLTRLRTPTVADYGQYADLVTAACAQG